MAPLQVLILGGSSEASALARALAGDSRFAAELSLAGRTAKPVPLPVPIRVGGFGGAAGLAAHLGERRVDALVDATHPFAVRMKANAVEGARLAGVALLAVRRPPWRPVAGDDWREVADMEAAAVALGQEPRRVFLTVGRLELEPFLAAPHHRYILRSVEPPPVEALPPGATVIAARGPFVEADELRLMRDRRVETLVTKNSGGEAAAAKLAAARRLGVPVVMVRRPPAPEAPSVETVEAALAWLASRHGAPASARRGV